MTIDESVSIIERCLTDHIGEHDLTSRDEAIVMRVWHISAELVENISELKEWCER